MTNYYDQWLAYWDEEKKERAEGRTFIHEEELEWVRTKQDHRSALLCSRLNGFVTTGDVTLNEIPERWHTGRHSHGEEAIFIVQGSGFSVIDDGRYDWKSGSCVFVPFGLVHQHFNTGRTTVRYLSVMAMALERFAGLAKIMQYDEAAETSLGTLEGVAAQQPDVHPDYGRIVLHYEDAPQRTSKDLHRKDQDRKDEFHLTKPKEMRAAGAPGHRSRFVHYMGLPQNNFKAREMEITNILCDAPGPDMRSGKHSHMEAVLYILEGEGYSVIDGEKIPWKKGSLIQVQGPRTVHQHFNTGDVESQQLRIHYGIRSQFFQAIARRVFPYQYYEFSTNR
ncbi:MAG: cupin domain-containing protein [Desulfobacterales bacterium]|nr:cupin domain-containing protein [Desulfobacterales bacterium]